MNSQQLSSESGSEWSSFLARSLRELAQPPEAPLAQKESEAADLDSAKEPLEATTAKMPVLAKVTQEAENQRGIEKEKLSSTLLLLLLREASETAAPITTSTSEIPPNLPTRTLLHLMDFLPVSILEQLIEDKRAKECKKKVAEESHLRQAGTEQGKAEERRCYEVLKPVQEKEENRKKAEADERRRLALKAEEKQKGKVAATAQRSRAFLQAGNAGGNSTLSANSAIADCSQSPASLVASSTITIPSITRCTSHFQSPDSPLSASIQRLSPKYQPQTTAAISAPVSATMTHIIVKRTIDRPADLDVQEPDQNSTRAILGNVLLGRTASVAENEPRDEPALPNAALGLHPKKANFACNVLPGMEPESSPESSELNNDASSATMSSVDASLSSLLVAHYTQSQPVPSPMSPASNSQFIARAGAGVQPVDVCDALVNLKDTSSGRGGNDGTVIVEEESETLSPSTSKRNATIHSVPTSTLVSVSTAPFAARQVPLTNTVNVLPSSAGGPSRPPQFIEDGLASKSGATAPSEQATDPSPAPASILPITKAATALLSPSPVVLAAAAVDVPSSAARASVVGGFSSQPPKRNLSSEAELPKSAQDLVLTTVHVPKTPSQEPPVSRIGVQLLPSVTNSTYSTSNVAPVSFSASISCTYPRGIASIPSSSSNVSLSQTSFSPISVSHNTAGGNSVNSWANFTGCVHTASMPPQSPRSKPSNIFTPGSKSRARSRTLSTGMIHGSSSPSSVQTQTDLPLPNRKRERSNGNEDGDGDDDDDDSSFQRRKRIESSDDNIDLSTSDPASAASSHAGASAPVAVKTAASTEVYTSPSRSYIDNDTSTGALTPTRSLESRLCDVQSRPHSPPYIDNDTSNGTLTPTRSLESRLFDVQSHPHSPPSYIDNDTSTGTTRSLESRLCDVLSNPQNKNKRKRHDEAESEPTLHDDINMGTLGSEPNLLKRIDMTDKNTDKKTDNEPLSARIDMVIDTSQSPHSNPNNLRKKNGRAQNPGGHSKQDNSNPNHGHGQGRGRAGGRGRGRGGPRRRGQGRGQGH